MPGPRAGHFVFLAALHKGPGLRNAPARKGPGAEHTFDLITIEELCCYRPSITAMRPNDLVQGTLGMLILRILALEPMHGWALSQRLKQMSKDVLQVGPGSLYPALHKLEQDGWITAEWLVSETKRRVKFYSLTREGRKQLERQTADWKRLSGAITAIVAPVKGVT